MTNNVGRMMRARHYNFARLLRNAGRRILHDDPVDVGLVRDWDSCFARTGEFIIEMPGKFSPEQRGYQDILHTMTESQCDE
jgi:hypothetical protein